MLRFIFLADHTVSAPDFFSSLNHIPYQYRMNARRNHEEMASTEIPGD